MALVIDLPLLVIVLGPPASGKTTLARRLAADLSLPVMTKDQIKELLFDTLGTGDVEWSRRLGLASIRLLWRFAELQLAAGQSCLIESNFTARHAMPDLSPLIAHHPWEILQVLCRADAGVIVQRFAERATSGERHAGHRDGLRVTELNTQMVAEQSKPLPVGGHVIEVSTTRFADVDYPGTLARANALLHSCQRRKSES